MKNSRKDIDISLPGSSIFEEPKKKSLRGEVDYYKKEKAIILDLSDAIIKVRNKDDLIKVFASRLKVLFHFTHAVISLVDKKKSTYYPFLYDTSSMHIKHRSELPKLLLTQFFLDDPFIQTTKGKETPVAFLLKDIIKKPGVPSFLKVNYETGIRQAMIVKLKNKLDTIGFVFIYSESEQKFSEVFKNIIQSIAPLLSNAVANIIINDEMKSKEFVTQTLLSLSNDMVTVRDKSDLLNVISTGLKKVIYFTHSVMLSLDEAGKTYHAFLTDPQSKIKNLAGYEDVAAMDNPIDDGIFDRAYQSEKPITINIESVNPDDAPLWVKLNYQAGVKELMLKMLPGRKQCLILYSDKTAHFNEDSFQIVDRISSQLATAVNNIIANDEIIRREQENEMLLSLSSEIAGVRNKNELLVVLANKLKDLFAITGFGITLLNEDGNTHSPFVVDGYQQVLKEADYKPVTAQKYPVHDNIFNVIMEHRNACVLDVEKIVTLVDSPAYAHLWKIKGVKKVLGLTLRVSEQVLGCLIFHLAENFKQPVNYNLVNGVSAQISVAISNIKANGEIMRQEEEKSFLLNFSNDIASVRTKADLESAINNVFQNVLHIELTMLRLIADDGIHIPPYIYNKTAAYTKDEIYEKLVSAKLTIHEELTERVLLSNNPVVFNIEHEERMGNKGPYIYMWKKAGFKNAYGAPLRVGNTDLGTLWILANDINLSLLKGICSQLSTAISNIKANEKILAFKEKLEEENDQLKDEIKSIYNSADIVGNGPEMQQVYSMISLVAPSNSTVLLLGETGTGKELVARAVHNASPRKSKLMIKVNCAALPANLIESELFGHERGSFTGAIERRIGKFEMANNSTLFLDEIGEMPLETQVKLLRVIQEREFERLGGQSTIKVDVRIVAATNRNLEDEVKAGRFRSDLYYRLNVFPINLPPLRNRPEDIAPLASFFLARYSKNTGKKVVSISQKVMKELKSYVWPGNVRELEHLIERSVLLSHSDVLTEIQLPKKHDKNIEHSSDIFNKSLHEVERTYIIETLRRCDGKIAGVGGAAEILDIPSTTLHSKMLKLNISKADYFVKSDG